MTSGLKLVFSFAWFDSGYMYGVSLQRRVVVSRIFCVKVDLGP